MPIHNFNAGPAVLPRPVLEEIQAGLLDTQGTGFSILEWSHRSPEYDAVRGEAAARLRRLMELPEGDTFQILFLQGGASLQFAMVPLNLASPEQPGAYVLTGVWARKAFAEAERLECGRAVWSGEKEHFRSLPSPGGWSCPPESAYLHLTSNNTIFGTQWDELPSGNGIPLVVDMSSDILSRPRRFSECGLIYAGAQKNLGPAGVTVVILRQELLDRSKPSLPAMLDYRAHRDANGIYNTHPTFAVYVMSRVLAWIEQEGGLAIIAQRNRAKAALLYREIDGSGFYRGTAEKTSRSLMNVTFRLAQRDLEKNFLVEARREGMVGLEGHRAVGGLRASLYNALPLASVEALATFMQDFEKRHG